jgi:GntR family transcriptional regulator
MSWDLKDLDPGPLPLWFQIADRLRRSVEQGEFRPGDPLPSEAKLNERFGVSRTTARAALDRLENEGLIVRRSGKGSVVLSPRVEQSLNVLSSFAEDMRRRGLTPSYVTRAAAYAAAPAEVAEALGVERGTPVFRVMRLLNADGWPMAVSQSWIAPSVLKAHGPPSPDDLDSGSLYDWLERECGARIVGGCEYIEAAIAKKRVATALGIAAGAATLVARRRAHAADGTAVEYAIVHYCASRYRYRVELVRP